MASLTPVRQTSDRLKIPAGKDPKNMYPIDFPSTSSSPMIGTEMFKGLTKIMTKQELRGVKKSQHMYSMKSKLNII